MRAWPWLILLAAVIAATAPLLVLGYPDTNSYALNVSWAGQFVELLRSGLAYPRWLPESFDGLGAPTFVFYAPLPFYLMGLIDLLSGSRLGPEALVSIASAAMVAASAVTMRRWLLRYVDPPRAAVGATIYVLAPYHMLDAHVRGSLGELAAYALLPPLAGALETTLQSPRRGWPWLAIWTSLLVLSHLPSTLVVGLVAIPLRIAGVMASRRLRAARKLRFLLHACLGGAMGLGLSAVYWVPAIRLMRIASFNYGDSDHFMPRSWLITNLGAWPDANLMMAIAFMYLGLAVISVLGIVALGKHGDGFGLSWSAALAGICLAMVGGIPFIWDPHSPLFHIQFPWRLLLVGEFLAVTIVMRVSACRPSPMALRAIAMAVLPMAAAIGGVLSFAIGTYRDRESPSIALRRELSVTRGPEAVEYLPQGHPFRYSGSGITTDQFLELVSSHPRAIAAWTEPRAAGQVRVWPALTGEARIEVVTKQPARIVLRRFHFPLWRLEAERSGAAAPPIAPTGEDRLLSFEVPAGTWSFRLAWSPPLIMAASAWVSGIAVVLLIWCGFVMPMRRRRRIPG